MCLIAFAWQQHPRYRLALIANRDEFHARPAAAAQAHADAAQVFGGRDLEKGGSWLLVSQAGRFAAVTNVRAGLAPETAPLSRGALVDMFVKSERDIETCLAELATQASLFGRFNLLLGDGQSLMFVSNHPQFRRQAVPPGLHMLSNGDLDAPWPKARHTRQALADWLASDAVMTSAPQPAVLFDALRDEAIAADADLPDTGVGLELERRLSASFIVGERYGTRASSVLLMAPTQILLHERRYRAGGASDGETALIVL